MGLSSIIKSIDRDPYPTQVRFAGQTSYRSITGGIISLIFLIIVLVIVFFKVLDLVQMNHLSVSTSIAKNDFSLVEVDASALRFLVQNSKTHQFLPKDKLSQNGVNLTIEKHYISQTEEKLQEIELIPCQNEQMFCIPSGYNFSIFGRTDITGYTIQPYQGVAVKFKTCYKDIHPECQLYQNNLILFTLMTNNIILPNNKQDYIQQQYRYFQLHSVLQLAQNFGATFFLKKVIIQTDESILPEIVHSQVYKEELTWFYDEELAQESYINLNTSGYHNDLMKIYFKRSLYTNTYTRQFQKFDNMLAIIFGLVGLLSIVVFCLYRGYNKWSYDQWKLKQLKKQHKSINLFRYYLACLLCEQNNEELIMYEDIKAINTRISQLENREENESIISASLSQELMKKRNTIN